VGIANSARGLVPLFSMSSSKGRNKNVLAHPPRRSVSVGEFHGRLFTAKNSSNLPVDITSHPKTIRILADKK